MQNRFLLLLLILFSLYPITSLAQADNGSIRTELNNDAINLVTDVFIKGTCKNISNIESLGAPESFGLFQNGENIIGFSDGIILSTGDARSAEGPNNFVETTTQFNQPSIDKDLQDVATDDLFDVTVLEFDFIPVEGEVTFQYVFASEEYCEFVGTIFNDVFGFFVSGPGIDGPFADGAINVARLPDSEEFVSINNVNHERNRQFYVKNELRDDIDNCNLVFNPSHIDAIEYDGFTVPLVARIPVIPCETYHIRLVVGDVGDDKLDSAVFLRSKSFDLGELATVKAVIPNQEDTLVYENCLDGQFIFTRPIGSLNLQPLVLDFVIDELSTALEGIDYATIPRSVTIPAGQDTVVLPISTLQDEETESIESLTVNLNFSQTCECKEGSNATLRLVDTRPPDLFFSPFSACVNQSFSLVPQISDGVPPFDFRWNDNSTNNSLQATIQSPTNFTLTVTDFCNNQTIDTILINIQELPNAALSGEIDYCKGLENSSLPLNFNGHPPWSFTYQINDNLPLTIDSIFDDNFNLPISEAGNYQLIGFSDAACVGASNGEGQVNDINIEVTVEPIPPSCPDIDDGRINLTVLVVSPPFDINWSPEVNDALNPSDLSVGVYEIKILDAKNCVFMDSILIENPSVFNPGCANNAVYIPNTFSPNGDGINDFFEIFLANQTTVQQVLKVEIMDRWGNLVYLSKGITPKWDGRLGGKLLNPGVFLYKIQLEFENGQIELLQGSFTLVK